MKRKLSELRYARQYRKARQLFDWTAPSPYHLSREWFEKLKVEYGHIPAEPFQDYSRAGMEKVARQRVEFLKKKCGGLPKRVLEIGAGAGYVLKEFRQQGVEKAISVDIIDQMWDEVKETGVELHLSSAEDMVGLEDKSFDLILSWGSLEHIPDPKAVFDECCRLLAPGGYLYLEFGPLYYSSWGYHHQATLRLPYMHLLFPETWIHELCREKRGEAEYRNYLPWVNGEPLSAYQFCLETPPMDFLLDRVEVGRDWYSLDLVRRFPSVFKAKGVPFDNFVVDGIKYGIRRHAD